MRPATRIFFMIKEFLNLIRKILPEFGLQINALNKTQYTNSHSQIISNTGDNPTFNLTKCLVPLSNGQDSDKKVLGYF